MLKTQRAAALERGGPGNDDHRLIAHPINSINSQLAGESEKKAPPAPRSLAAEISAVTALCRAQAREESADYPAVVAVLNDQWRIVGCRNSIQFILQRRHGPGRWEGRSYCRTRFALLRCVSEHAGRVDAAALASLQSLPERIGGAR